MPPVRRKRWSYESTFHPTLSTCPLISRPSTSKCYLENYVPKATVVTGPSRTVRNASTPSMPAASACAPLITLPGPHPAPPTLPFSSPTHPTSTANLPPPSALTPPAPRIRGLTSAAQRAAALNYALKYLARYKVSTADIFLHIFSEDKDDGMGRRRSSFLHAENSLEILLDRFQKYAPARVQGWVSSQSLPVIETNIGKEMDALKKKWQFGVNDMSSSYISMGLNLSSFRATIEQSAPTIWRLLVKCAQTDRAFDENKLKDPYALCAVVITQLARQRSARAGLFAFRFGFFLWACGCPRSIIDVLAQLGLCPSFHSIHDSLAILSESALEATKAAIRRPGVAWLNGYDNLNASISIHAAQQYLGSRPKVENFTARTIYIAKNASRNAMDAASFEAHSRNGATVTLGDLRPSAEVAARIQHQFTVQVIEILFQSPPFSAFCWDTILDYTDVHRPSVHTKTKQYPLTIVEIDESTVEGNRENLEDMVRLLGFSPEQASAVKIPTSGDQMTCSRIRSSAEEREADRSPYHRGTVWEPIPGGFHVMLNWLRMMLKVYRGSPADTCSLARYIDALNLKWLHNAEPDHFLLERLIREVYYGHILACWVEVSGHPTLEKFKSSQPSPPVLRRLAVTIVHKFIGAPSEDSFLTDSLDPTTTDETFRSACLFNRDAAIYFEMRSATKRGDFGRIEDLLPLLVCGFCGGGSTKYAHEMLHFLQNLKYTWPKAFADMVRDNMFVNTTGRPLGYQEMDKNQEHAIRTYKFLLAARGMHADSKYLSTMGPLRDFLKDVIQSMRSELGAPHAGSRHSAVDVSRDRIRIMTTSVEARLFVKSSAVARHTQAKTPNTAVAGYELMAGASLRSFMALRASNADLEGLETVLQHQDIDEEESTSIPNAFDPFEEAAMELAEIEQDNIN